ncbi:spore protease YyaC [Ruminiclostridium cellobioparum]|uniref:spore protease YyaC n=1 Tax=Ruminiclostridium cellobioparum TaxID=29355 RepID=UPI0028B1C7A5|nr:spore protease YyaC [Ruminiclostridium cellobioparum]
MSLTVFEREERNTYYISSEEKGAVGLLADYIYSMILKQPNEYDRIVVVCIGTDRSTGDSLGPLVGKFLRKRRKIKKICKVWGSLDYPVHAKNLYWYLDRIQEEKPLVIAIDACLGKMENIGKIFIHEGSIKPGSGVEKELPEIGDISICGIVNNSGLLNSLILQNTRLSHVYKMAEIISEAINKALTKFINTGSTRRVSPVFKAD